MGCCKDTFKFVMLIMNIIMMAVGGFLLYCGIMLMTSNQGTLFEMNSKPVIITLSAGAFTILGSLFGIFGAYSEKKGCLGVYLLFIWTALIILVIMTALLLVGKKPVENSTKQFLSDQFVLYGLNSSVTLQNKTFTPNEDFNTTIFIDSLQKSMECCGFHNYTDWQTLPYASTNQTEVPLSCCKVMANCTGSLDDLSLIFEQGCEAPFEKEFSYYYGFMSFTSLGLAIVAFSAIIIAIGLLCARRSNPFDYTGFGEPGYTTV